MFKARKKEIRRRPMSKKKDDASDEDDGNTSDASVGTAPAAPPSTPAVAPGERRPKKMRKKVKGKVEKGPKPVLSFGHEDEEESGGSLSKAGEGVDGTSTDKSVFRVKKTKASKVQQYILPMIMNAECTSLTNRVCVVSWVSATRSSTAHARFEPTSRAKNLSGRDSCNIL